jgi:hypothetical protein
MACLSDFWTVEGSHLKVVGLATEVEDVIAEAEVAAARLPALRVTLAAVVLNSMIFSDAMTSRALARLEELGPGPEDARSAALVRVLLAACAGLADGDPGPIASRRCSGRASSTRTAATSRRPGPARPAPSPSPTTATARGREPWSAASWPG